MMLIFFWKSTLINAIYIFFWIAKKYFIIVVYPFKWNTVFGNNIKSKMGILNLIRKIYFNEKNTQPKIFFWSLDRFS